MATPLQSKMLAAAESIGVLKTLIQKDQDNSQKLAQEVKHHEDNIKDINSHVNNIDESIHHLQGELKRCHSSSMAVEEDDTIIFTNTEKQVTDQMRQLEETAAGVICELKDRHGSMLSTLKCTKDVVGIVASLGKVADDNLSRILAEYLGMSTMLAIVCKTLDGVQALEYYEDATIDKNVGLHGIAPTIGRILNGRFIVFCLQNLRPFNGEVLSGDSQKRLALMDPRLPNGKLPPGFLGFAVNMIHINDNHLSRATIDGRGLRETLFFTLFSRLQVYETRKDMIDAIPFISDGAVSLDGGIIKCNGLFCLGDRYNFGIRFPIADGTPNPLKEAAEIEQKIKLMEWKKQMLFADIQKEEALINNVKCVLKAKSDRYKKLINEEHSNKELMKNISKTDSPRS
ncbi:hypothetical protein KSP40_PGU008499 [Platanthera guangdongensis]|uniref:Protein DEFECTIVE IN MERISTEM SILENCING 3 n=1 Tax=Platanthera guangdongensis TaxID=2320717 RepID=A0ABR2LEQ6_9ASPA